VDSHETLNIALGAAEEHPEEAARLLREQRRREPKNAAACAALGYVLLKLGEVEMAIDTLDEAHYLQPDEPTFLYQYGMALQSAGKMAEARRRFEAALALDPNHREARAALTRMPAPMPGPSSWLEGRLAELGENRPRSRGAPAPTPPTAPDRGTNGTASNGRVTENGAASYSEPEVRPEPRELDYDSRRNGRRPPRERPTKNERVNQRMTASERRTARRAERGSAELTGVAAIATATLQLWLGQGLVWLTLLVIPNFVAVLVSPDAPALRPLTALIWVAAFALGLAPTILGMASEWVHGRPFKRPWRLTGERLTRGVTTTSIYLLLTLGGFCVLAAYRTPLPPHVLLPGMLLLTLPLHAVFAPGLVLGTTDGPSGWSAMVQAWHISGTRTVVHLCALLVIGCLLAGWLAVLSWLSAGSVLQGNPLASLLLAIGVSLGETLWAAAVTLCGLDALGGIHREQALGVGR
jgi:hypothetical protein